MDRRIFKIKVNRDLDWGYIPGSLKLTLRNAAKEAAPNIYFSEAPVEGVKNLGCYAFGQPDAWASVVSIPLNRVIGKTLSARADRATTR